MPEQERFERLARLEVHYENMNNDISDLRKNVKEELENLKKESREDMRAIKEALLKIQEQTSSWKNIFWGVTITVTVIGGIFQWVLSYFGLNFGQLLRGKE